jgi:glycosyltransferase involved in cell wall biosynthesis
MRIAYTYLDRQDVMPIHSLDVIRELSRLGHDVTLFASLTPASALAGDLTRLGVEIIRIPSLPVRVLNEFSFLVCLGLQLMRHGLRRRPDIIYIRHASPSLVAGWVGKLLRVPVCLEINDILLKRTDYREIPFCKRLWVRFYERFAFPLAARLFPVTDGINGWLQNVHGIPAGVVQTMPNGVNLERFRPGDAQACRIRFSLPPGAQVVGYLGSIFHWAGLETLIDAAPEIVRRMPDTLFVVGGGDEPCYTQLMERVRTVEFADHFRFFGAVDWKDASDFINTFDLAVAPAFFKNAESGISSQKVLAYLACGKPVVGSDLRGLGDMLESHQVGKSFRMGDSQSLAQVILRCLSEKNLLEDMQRKARPFVEAYYAWHEIVKRTAGHMAGLLRTSPGRRAGKEPARCP